MILLHPHPLLRQKATSMRQRDPDLEDRMLQAAPPDALGLAAPQIGVAKQLVFVREPGQEPLWIYNPRIELQGEQKPSLEGCLSLPEQLFWVLRHETVQWRGRGRDWKKIGGKAEDLLAVILQHETDHLRGILISDTGIEEKRPEVCEQY